MAYDDSEPRDRWGMWTAGPGGAAMNLRKQAQAAGNNGLGGDMRKRAAQIEQTSSGTRSDKASLTLLHDKIKDHDARSGIGQFNSRKVDDYHDKLEILHDKLSAKATAAMKPDLVKARASLNEMHSDPDHATRSADEALQYMHNALRKMK